MNPVDLLRLDDEIASNGIHLTTEQRIYPLEAVWNALTEEERDAVRDRIEHR